ncbi:hypothetical protein HRR80_007348 [Exophiala dermatitidis]|uniref:Uncharacterized protein n=1 Tax=Exophiala dermatitidis TaxID=5970 RepID=A0AAN6ER06_EXODE|nr:hypothetical protein HRR79_006471 [Exophiala dermatitidis]KAJ4609409.1 hypothetical protein HRR85_006604 [Exophiala dermatitidis]KAJ8988721.1 hypothetical protein HRR80_007348 [Exophiala dermatitidis]
MGALRGDNKVKHVSVCMETSLVKSHSLSPARSERIIGLGLQAERVSSHPASRQRSAVQCLDIATKCRTNGLEVAVPVSVSIRTGNQHNQVVRLIWTGGLIWH